MKKSVALLFIISANLVFLVHVLIPHHHHKSEVFVINAECETYCNSKTHTATQHNNEQENTDYCSLNQVFVVSQNQLHQDLELLKTSNIDLFSNFVLAIFIDEISINHIAISSATNGPPLLNNKYINFIPLAKGLRAPPKV
jgi:hypothetical protein